jgi:hypothetical protein
MRIPRIEWKGGYRESSKGPGRYIRNFTLLGERGECHCDEKKRPIAFFTPDVEVRMDAEAHEGFRLYAYGRGTLLHFTGLRNVEDPGGYEKLFGRGDVVLDRVSVSGLDRKGLAKTLPVAMAVAHGFFPKLGIRGAVMITPNAALSKHFETHYGAHRLIHEPTEGEKRAYETDVRGGVADPMYLEKPDWRRVIIPFTREKEE